MGVTTTQTNKPFNPRGNDQSPLAYNRAKLYSGKALDFDGVNDSVDIGQNLAFINTGDFTFLANAKFDVLSGDECIIGQGSAGAGLAVLALVNGNGFFRFAFYGDDLDWDEPVETGKWYSLAFTFNRTTKARAIYVNGQLAVSDVSTLTPNASVNNFFVGKVPYSATYADAQITGVKAFNTALTAAQVADLYNNPEKVVPTGVDNTALKLWLPMMEGAGTTAYDGSGNGNHGTISGATYVHGIGAPVAQSAVIDWNKGQNLATYSEQLDNADYEQSGAYSVIANATTAPDGKTTAEQITIPNTQGYYKQNISVSASTDYVFSFYAKKGTAYDARHNIYNNVGGANITAITSYISQTSTTEWTRIEVPFTTPSGCTEVGVYVDRDSAGNGTMFYWGFQVEQTASVGPYIPTFATNQPNDVLLPQGLTTGRDITGVNLFENVRKQGALNLDGNSWAEVHDNESLDITDAVTLEAWVKWDTDGVQNKGILGKWASSAGYLLYKSLSTRVNFFINGNSSLYISLTNGWNHIVGTYDGANRKVYINGALEETDADTSTITQSTFDVEIGTYGGFGSSAYDQPIAQPRIYNRALTAEEVQRNYNAGKNTYTN